MNTGQIIKSKTTQNFTVVPNEILRSDDLSLQAKGLMCYLLHLPDNWVIHKTELYKHATNGRDSTNSAFKELIDSGYIIAVEQRNEKGQFQGFNYVVYNERNLPFTENPKSGNPKSEKPISGNPPLLNTNCNKELINNKKEGKSDSLNRGTSLSENLKNCSNKEDIEESLKVADEVPNRNQSPIYAQSNLEEGTTRTAPIDAPEPVTDAAPKKTDEETFEEFWNHWHTLSGQPKTDKKESFGVWKELSLEDKRKAYRNTKLFIDNMLDSYKDSTFIKKAKNYLADQNFNDEFGKTQSKEGVLKGNFFDKKGQRELSFCQPYAAQ